MKNLFISGSAISVLSCLAGGTAPPPPVGGGAGPPAHTPNPNMSLSAPTNSPLQAQMRENYATSLRGAQRDQLRQNPSGLMPDQLAIGHELNGYMAPR